MPDKIFSNIKTIRELKGFTQQHMASRLSMTQAGYSRIEKGDGGISLEKLEAIAAVFEMDLQAVLNFEGHLVPRDAGRVPDFCGVCDISRLYRDKIALLEKLLHMAECELRKFREQS